jgi:amino acid permease
MPLWSLSLGLLLVMTASNLFSVRSFGEFEYWFAGIKVAAILLFMVTGGLYVLGLWPGHSMDFSNLTAGGSLFPNGWSAIFSGIVIVVFSMVGAEIATIAAAESPDPANAIIKATRSVIVRILLFYIGSIFRCLSGCNPQPLALVFGHAHGRSPAWRSSAPTIAPRVSATFPRRRGLRRLLGEDSLERRVHLPPLSGGGRAVPLR